MKAETKEVAVSKKQKAKNRIAKVLTITLCAVMCVGQIGFCDTNTVVSNLVAQIISMMSYVGIVVLVIGVAKFALALKDENPDGQTRAVYYAIAGAVLIGLRVIVSNLHIPGLNI